MEATINSTKLTRDSRKGKKNCEQIRGERRGARGGGEAIGDLNFSGKGGQAGRKQT